MNFGRGLREGHNYFMGVHSTIASSEAIAFFCRIFSFPGRNVLYIPSYEQTRLAIDKNICEEISRLLCQLKKKERGKKKEEEKNDFSIEFYDSIDIGLLSSPNWERNEYSRSMLLGQFPLLSVGVASCPLQETAKLEQGWFEFSVNRRAKIIGELSTCNNNYFVSFYRKPRN